MQTEILRGLCVLVVSPPYTAKTFSKTTKRDMLQFARLCTPDTGLRRPPREGASMDDQMEQAHHELSRLQDIISRHEGHMFALRGWLLTVIGGLLAAYYTDNIRMSEVAMRFGLPVVAFLFLFVESRHANLVEAVADRASKVERCIRSARSPRGDGKGRWYDGPRVSEACLKGARRFWPRAGMTFLLNRPFYVVVVLIILFVTIALPPRSTKPPASEAATHQVP
jgi:hypothetical protein